MKKFFADFKKFISRGNVIDMAVAVIVGNAFGKIVTSLVNDILMPLVTWGLGAASIADLSIPLRWEYVTDPTTLETIKNVTLSWKYGNFLQTIIDFLIISFCIFTVLKLVMKSQEFIKTTAKNIEKMVPDKSEKKILKERGVNLKDKVAVREALKQLAAEAEEERLRKEAEQPKKETQEDILKEIRSLMVKQVELAEKGSLSVTEKGSLSVAEQGQEEK